MTPELLHSLLLGSTLLNYAMLLAWFAIFAFARDRMHAIHSRWFRLPPGAFDTIHYAGMGLYKLGIMLFNLGPWLALSLAT